MCFVDKVKILVVKFDVMIYFLSLRILWLWFESFSNVWNLIKG